jgi:type IV pilus assembly protein PilN
MIKINLIAEAPTTPAARRKRTEVSLGAKQGDMILLIVLGLAVAVGGINWYLLSSKNARLRERERAAQEERDKLQVFIERVEQLEAKRDVLKQKITIIDQLKQNQFGPVRIMDEVSRALPDLTWLEQMNLQGNQVTLSGRAMDENAVANYITNLDESLFFQEPSLTDLSRADGDTFRFTLTCVFTYKPPKIEGQQVTDETGT